MKYVLQYGFYIEVDSQIICPYYCLCSLFFFIPDLYTLYLYKCAVFAMLPYVCYLCQAPVSALPIIL